MGRERTSKRLKVKGNIVSADALLIMAPGRDVAFSARLPRILSQDEVPAEAKRVEAVVKEWFASSEILDQDHFIYIVNCPDGYKITSAIHSMIFTIDVSVYSTEEIGMGRKEGSFLDVFQPELERLIAFLEKM